MDARFPRRNWDSGKSETHECVRTVRNSESALDTASERDAGHEPLRGVEAPDAHGVVALRAEAREGPRGAVHVRAVLLPPAGFRDYGCKFLMRRF